MFITFLDTKGIVHREFVPASQTVNSANYCDVLRRLRNMCEDFVPNFGDKRQNWLLHHDNTPSHTFFFTREFFTKNNMAIVLHPPYFSLFPQLMIKLKGRHFDTTEVIEAES
jgi:hypothetical protein